MWFPGFLNRYLFRFAMLVAGAGFEPTTTTPIFSTPLGLMYEPRTYEDLFKRTLKEAKVPDINFHALRHTFATRALETVMNINWVKF